MTSKTGPGLHRKGQAVDLSSENIHWDFRQSMSYGDYLVLKDLLSCQRPLTGEHDETLFIVMH